MRSDNWESNTAKKRPSKFLKVLFGVIAIFVVFIVIGIVVGPGSTPAISTHPTVVPTSNSYSIKYEVTGTASTVSVTYENEDGGTSQYSDRSVPWSHSFTAHPGDFVYISAQNQGDSGSVTTTIYKDSSIWKTSTSSGAYVIATASDMLP